MWCGSASLTHTDWPPLRAPCYDQEAFVEVEVSVFPCDRCGARHAGLADGQQSGQGRKLVCARCCAGTKGRASLSLVPHCPPPGLPALPSERTFGARLGSWLGAWWRTGPSDVPGSSSFASARTAPPAPATSVPVPGGARVVPLIRRRPTASGSVPDSMGIPLAGPYAVGDPSDEFKQRARETSHAEARVFYLPQRHTRGGRVRSLSLGLTLVLAGGLVALAVLGGAHAGGRTAHRAAGTGVGGAVAQEVVSPRTE